MNRKGNFTKMKQLKEKTVEMVINHKYEIAILLFTFLYLTPIIKCYFISDDGIYYYSRGKMILSDNSIDIFKIAYEKIIGWVSRGRFFPLAVYALFVMYFLNNNLLYKTVIILAICINVSMFGVFVEELTESKRIKLLLMLFMNLFFQIITVYHSPFLSFHMFMQVMFAILMLILINLQRYLKKKEKKNLVLSIVFFTIGLLTYELAFAYFGIIVFFIIYFNKSILKSLKLCFYYVMPLGIIAIINIAVKMRNEIGYDGVSFAYSPLRIIVTIMKQCYAAFPLSNYIVSKNNRILKGDIVSVISNISVQDLLILALFLILLYVVLKHTEKIILKVYNSYFLLFCLAFFIFPGVLSSLTEKYQRELGFGIAHISVYIQYFGLIMLFLWLYVYFKNKFKNKKISKFYINSIRNIALLLIAIIILLNQQNARLYINNANLYWKYPKEAVQNALKLNILDDLKENDTLSVLTPYAWESSEFYSEFSSKKIHYTPIETVIHDKADKMANTQGLITVCPQNTYIIRYYGNEGEQEAFLGKVESIYSYEDIKNTIKILVSNVKVFTDNINKNHVLYQSIDKDGNPRDEIVKTEDLSNVQRDGTKTVYQISNSTELIDFNTISFIQHYTKPIEQIVINYGRGISDLEASPEEKWRWCEKDAEIEIINTTKEEINIQISVATANFLQDMSRLYLEYDGITKSFEYNHLGSSMVFNAILKPGSNIIKLNTDAPRVDAPNDSRIMHFKLTDFRIVKTD